jgi:autotransporter-associated beta strand protein
MDTKKVSLVVAILALVIAVGSVFVSVMVQDNPTKTIGAVGSMLVEDYVPVIKFNEGYYSGLPISLTGADGDLTVSSLGTLTLSGTNTFNGTTTVLASYDGFFVQPTTAFATGTPMVYTNTTGKTIMFNTGAFMANSLNANLGRNFKVSMGTSTGIVGAGINLLSTTTVATTSDTILTLTYTKPFMLANNESIIVWFADADANASTTYFNSTYWELQTELQGALMGN